MQAGEGREGGEGIGMGRLDIKHYKCVLDSCGWGKEGMELDTQSWKA